jgi:2-dehydropantoate 2-reductase
MSRAFAQGSIESEWRADVRPALWSKYLFIAPFGMVTACFDKTLGQVMESAELSSLVRSLMQEVLASATAQGVRLPESIVEDSYRKGGDFPAHLRTSFQRDFEDRGGSDERDLFGGAMIRLGERLGIATPRAREMESMINGMKPWPREAHSAR